MGLSQKQKDVLLFGKREGFFSCSVGAMRSGKSHGAVMAFFFYTQQLPKPYHHLLMGRNRLVIETELLELMEKLATATETPYSYSRYTSVAKIGRQSYHVVAGNDERSQGRVMGYTMHSALADELTLLPQSFFNAATSRLTYADSKVWGTCNPHGPLHWLKQEWLDAGKAEQHEVFTFEDNPTLPEETKERYRGLYSGVFYQRMVDGVWAQADGLIWPDWETLKYNTKPIRVDTGVDYGIASPSAFVALGEFRDGSYIVTDMEYIHGDNKGNNPDDNYIADRLVAFQERNNSRSALLDPSAASLRVALLKHKRRNFALRKADNDVEFGIRIVGAAAATRTLKLAESERLNPLVEELAQYSWDPDAEDKPIKMNDHACDALRYVAVDRLRRIFTDSVTLPKGM